MPKFTAMGGPTGPVPKRPEARRRRNKVEGAVVVDAISDVVAVPATPKGLHPLAATWFESLAKSGQSRYYEPSDWAAALIVAESITRLFSKSDLSAMGFGAVWSAMGELLTTEGMRRRVRMEVQRAQVEEVPEGVTAIEAFRERMAQGG